MLAIDLLAKISAFLDREGCQYFVSGSVASSVWGEPRFTYDIDIIIFLRMGQLPEFTRHFVEPEWYLSTEAMRRALEHDAQFNVLHVPSGLKIDFMCSDNGPFDRERFARFKRVELRPGLLVPIAAPDDVIIKKLVYYKGGLSPKHLRDIGAIMRVSGEFVDTEYVARWATHFGVADVWTLCKEQIGW